MKPAALLTWPLHMDFPVCRWNLERYKDYFDGIYIALSNHHVENADYSNYIRAQLPFCTFIAPKRTRDDWRNDSVNNMLDVATAEYICFLEQDFLIKDTTFFDKVFAKPHDFLFYREDQRLHPAFAVVKRELLEKTDKDFSATPPMDHFGHFFAQLPLGTSIEAVGVVKKEDFVHLGGTGQNYFSFAYDEPFYHPNNFLYFNWKNLQFPTQHPQFKALEDAIERKYGHPKTHVFLDRFFPEKEVSI